MNDAYDLNGRDRCLPGQDHPRRIDGQERRELTRLCAEVERLRALLREAHTVMTWPTIGTTRMDSPEWYHALRVAVQKIDAELAKGAT